MTIIFLIYAAAIAFGVRTLIWRYGTPKLRLAGIPLVAIWLIGTLLLGATGKLGDPDAFPPGMMKIILPIAVLWISILVSSWGKQFAGAVPIALLTGLQAFRVPVELFIHHLVGMKLMPEMMTWTGANFDILTGLSAPLMAAWIVQGKAPRWALVAWNLAGMALLLNVVTRGVLTAPGPQQMILTDVPNVAVTQFPWVAIPSIFVAVAGALHLLSLRKLSRKI